jgi:DNA polymerase-3 subunit delta'
MNTLYPWLAEQWRTVTAARAQDRMPHALLLYGARGMGKNEFAGLLAQSLLCERPRQDWMPCERCAACRLYGAGSHPDFRDLCPQEEGKAIKIDQVRELALALALKSHGNAFKVGLIRPADAMNANAANSLLKTLEEPTDNTVLLLVSERPARLPATIRSRCQMLRFGAPSRADTLAWMAEKVPQADAELLLGLAADAPLLALEMAGEGVLAERRLRFEQWVSVSTGREDPVAIAQEWARETGLRWLRWLHDWLTDMIRIRLAGPGAMLRNSDLRDELCRLAQANDCTTLFEQLDRTTRASRLVSSGSINRQLLTEEILVMWTPARGAGPGT